MTVSLHGYDHHRVCFQWRVGLWREVQSHGEHREVGKMLDRGTHVYQR